MQIIEVKNEIAKIIYNPTENHLLPSDFLLVEDVNQKLIAQVLSVETTDESNKNLAILRLSLSIDFDDNLSYYNGYIPSKDANLIYINPDEIIELIRGTDTSIYFGNLSNRNACYAHTNISLIDDKAYILSDRADATKVLSQNLIAELHSKGKKVIVLDFNGQYNSFVNVGRLKFNENIKLPLDIDAFDTILEHDIVDCPLEDKAVIQSIVLELREYMNTLEDKYIPFNMFKNVVDTEFIASPISGLMLLRNKLWMYSQTGMFADYKEDFDVIDSSLEESSILIIDASNVDEKWYKFILKTVIELTSTDCYLFISLNDINLDRKSIVNLYNKANIIPITSTSYDSAYKNILNSLTKNFVFCKPSSFIQDNEPYSILLNRMNNNEIILYGETTLYLPLLVELKLFDGHTKDDVIQNDVKKDVDKLLSSPQSLLPKSTNIMSELLTQENISDEELLNAIPEDTLTDGDLDFLDEISTSEVEEQEKENLSPDGIVSSSSASNQDVQVQQNQEYNVFSLDIPEEHALNQVKEEIKTISTDDDFDILNEPFVPLVEVNDDNNINSSAIDETLSNTPSQPIEKVQVDSSILSQEERVVAEELNNQDETFEEEKSDKEVSEEEISSDEYDSSLDDLLVDENSVSSPEDASSHLEEDATENTVEDKDQVEQQVNINTEEKQKQPLVIEFEDDEEDTPPPVVPIVQKKQEIPVYETDNQKGVAVNDIPFKIGDRVYHPKHGKGTIDSFANYSNKILFCNIIFDNVGRRILDPRISGIEKIEE